MGDRFDRASCFVRSIGIEVRIEAGVTGFLEGIKLVGGAIVVSSDDDAMAGDLLHEAGHIAVIPMQFRHLIAGSLRKVTDAMMAYLDAHPDGFNFPEDPICRSIMQSGETEAVAWSYAAAVAAGVDTFAPFERGFDGNGREVHDWLAEGAYLGINGLSACGMTRVRPAGGLPGFPTMIRWVQIHPLPSLGTQP